MKTQQPISNGMLLLQMLLFVALGAPLVAYVWETLNELLALHINPLRLLITIPVALGLVALLWMLGRSVQRWEGRKD